VFFAYQMWINMSYIAPHPPILYQEEKTKASVSRLCNR